MGYLYGKLIKEINVPGAGCIHVVARDDGYFQFHERIRLPGAGWESTFDSGLYISVATAEAAARRKFNL